MPEIPDIDRLIAEVAARHGILLKKDDAAFALVTLNQLILEAAIADLVGKMQATTSEFDAAMERVQTRAGAALAKQITAVVLDIGEKLEGAPNTTFHSPRRESPALQWNLLGAFVAGVAVGLLLAWLW